MDIAQAPWQDMGQPEGQDQVVRPKQQNKMYSEIVNEPAQDVVMIIGTLLIHSTPAIASFDSD